MDGCDELISEWLNFGKGVMDLAESSPQMQFIDKVVDVPGVTQQTPIVQMIQKTTEIPRLHDIDKVIDVPVVLVVRVPQLRVVEQTVEIPQLQLVEKIVVIIEILTVQGVPVHQVAQEEINR